MDVAVDRRLVQGGRQPWLLARRGEPDRLEAEAGLDPLLAHLLRNRGLRQVERARWFLQAESQPLGEPGLLADLPAAVERIGRALQSGERIAIYGDYDADGLTGLALLTRALTWSGGEVLPFVPHRGRDGYGLNSGRLRSLRERGASLVVTVDCGVTAEAEIAFAAQLGLDLIVTDHHVPPPELPPVCVVNPLRADCHYPDKTLAGSGVAHRLAEAVLRARLPPEAAAERSEQLLALAAIGTLGDVVPMLGENRVIVRRGLRQLASSAEPGLAALATVAGLELDRLDAEAVSFQIVPRLNAAGRLESASLALELLLTDSDQQASTLARRLDELNTRRRELTEEALARARAAVASSPDQPITVVAGDYPLGVVGLVAGRLVEDRHRPAIVLARDGQRLVGSARSPHGFNLLAALGAARHLLERYGGHPHAAGLSLPVERLAEFERALQASADRSGDLADQPPLVEVDAELRPATVGGWQLLDLLSRLEPHGVDNPPPLFLTRGLLVTERREFGPGHARLRLQAEGRGFEAVAFRRAEQAPPAGRAIDLVHRPRRRLWRGALGLSLEVVDWRFAAADRPAGSVWPTTAGSVWPTKRVDTYNCQVND
jgi:single-stranded-DNA-specific exonuclease